MPIEFAHKDSNKLQSHKHSAEIIDISNKMLITRVTYMFCHRLLNLLKAELMPWRKSDLNVYDISILNFGDRYQFHKFSCKVAQKISKNCLGDAMLFKKLASFKKIAKMLLGY